MKRKRRIWVCSVVLVLAMTAAFFIFVTGENPEYIRAASRLPEARQEARKVFGSLTWDEYRKQNGVDRTVDLSKWEDIADSVPQHIKEYWNNRYNSTATHHDLYILDREWFKEVPDQIAELHLDHQLAENGTEWDDAYTSASGKIMKALSVGLVGAAEDGDVAAVRRIGNAVNSLSRALLEEPSYQHFLRQHALIAIANNAMLRSAVRHRDDKALLECLKTVVAEAPVLPSFRDLISADARSGESTFNLLRSLNLEELEELLEKQAAFLETYSRYPPAKKKYIRYFENITGVEVDKNRRIGSNTVDAFEARYWEVMVESYQLMDGAVLYEPELKNKLRRHDFELNTNSDKSYEIITMVGVDLDQIFAIYHQRDFTQQVASAALELIRRFPSHDQLPEELPKDIMFPDPFGGKAILFKKTERGFLLYSRYQNLKDDGFQWARPEQKEREASYIRSLDNKDTGLIISYDSLELIP